MSKPRLFICGDSFNIGIGCQDLNTQPYATLLANTIDYDLVNLAKGSSTNLSIWLQVAYAVRQLNANENDIVIVAQTSHERFEWYPDSGDSNNIELTNLDVNYHLYPPYGEMTYHHKLESHPMTDNPGYTGRLLTENIFGVIDYLDNYVDKNQGSVYYTRLASEPIKKLRLIKDFYAYVHNDLLSMVRSNALMSMSHCLLKNKKIKHLVLIPWLEPVEDIIDQLNLMRFSWGELTNKYPDTIPSGHANEHGHIEAYEMILNRLRDNGWI